jgi:hypothetical protein
MSLGGTQGGAAIRADAASPELQSYATPAASSLGPRSPSNSSSGIGRWRLNPGEQPGAPGASVVSPRQSKAGEGGPPQGLTAPPPTTTAGASGFVLDPYVVPAALRPRSSLPGSNARSSWGRIGSAGAQISPLVSGSGAQLLTVDNASYDAGAAGAEGALLQTTQGQPVAESLFHSLASSPAPSPAAGGSWLMQSHAASSSAHCGTGRGTESPGNSSSLHGRRSAVSSGSLGMPVPAGVFGSGPHISSSSSSRLGDKAQ